jgi:hypothetical protein
MTTNLLPALALALLCASFAAAAQDDNSCAGQCGAQAPGGCWCDEMCCDLSDCCQDYHPHCGTCHQPPQCGDVDCDDTEGEPCGSDVNGGCNSSPPQFSPIAIGQTVCGNAWATGGVRDTDWYLFTLSQSMSVTWSVQSEVEMHAIIVGGVTTCDTKVIALLNGCDPSVTACLAPGTYAVFVAPAFFESFPCPGLTYTGTLTGQPQNCGGGCGGDLNNDGLVDVSDLLILLGEWGACPDCASDLNGDGVVDVSDLLALLGLWGSCY